MIAAGKLTRVDKPDSGWSMPGLNVVPRTPRSHRSEEGDQSSAGTADAKRRWIENLRAQVLGDHAKSDDDSNSAVRGRPRLRGLSRRPMTAIRSPLLEPAIEPVRFRLEPVHRLGLLGFKARSSRSTRRSVSD